MSEFPSRRLPNDAILFCAHCNESKGQARDDALGFYFTCPSDPAHLGRVILDQQPARFWLRREKNLLAWQTKWSPFAKFKFPAAGAYLVATTLFLGLAVGGWRWLWTWTGPYTPVCRVIDSLILVLAAWRFLDIYLSNLSITFTSKFPANPVRSVLFSFVAYAQIALCFALFYVVLGKEHFKEDPSPMAAVFYSFSTMATTGYGDLSPQTICARLVVISELILGLFFVAIIIAQVAGWASASRREEGEYPMEVLKRT